jgi:hypothetical protein
LPKAPQTGRPRPRRPPKGGLRREGGIPRGGTTVVPSS